MIANIWHNNYFFHVHVSHEVLNVKKSEDSQLSAKSDPLKNMFWTRLAKKRHFVFSRWPVYLIVSKKSFFNKEEGFQRAFDTWHFDNLIESLWQITTIKIVVFSMEFLQSTKKKEFQIGQQMIKANQHLSKY